MYVGAGAQALAYDTATGDVKWSTDIATPLWGANVDTVVSNDVVFVTVTQNFNSTIVALDVNTGEVLWSYASQYAFVASGSLGAGGFLFAGCEEGILCAFG